MKESEKPHARSLRLHRRMDVDGTFFVTKCVQPRKPVLDAELRGLVSKAFEFVVKEERIYLAAFVVMPDHWHGLFALRGAWALPRFMHSFMSFVGAKTNPKLNQQECCWQEGYYETRIRSAKQFSFIKHYTTVRLKSPANTVDFECSPFLNAMDVEQTPLKWAFSRKGLCLKSVISCKDFAVGLDAS